MKSTRVRVILAVAAAGVALTACSPNQVGAAAVVGGERISSSELDRNVREYEAALSKAGVSASELQFQDSVPQLVLFQLANAKQYAKVAESKGITATAGEIDQVIAGQGGQEKFEQQMLQQAVAPSHAREFIRSQVLISKLVAKYGGGTDEAAIQRGQQQAVKDLQAMPITWNPRYGQLNQQRSQEQPSVFVDAGRFGAPAAPAAPAAEQPETPQQ
ncbi:SurA N-terminal domain-containing protein [Streptosporangium sp. NBC_01755]|uniref:SurA N-terminal domain-containing protein n=1 Tax=unclassified Streptosporangium TaxID=2632669 RepID=UPI002DD944A6|nr:MULTISPECIES: SurA N-terminal domain-containing protein [unclassified Streptosporangium]WSA26086.1 SurA N-terminal domain-containing protein [Streptosporangium sp. NBC_01810]WSD02485.1 SurA N-terminal domain-containing protein [Streptosporangium sp. NBC_01755]